MQDIKEYIIMTEKASKEGKAEKPTNPQISEENKEKNKSAIPSSSNPILTHAVK